MQRLTRRELIQESHERKRTLPSRRNGHFGYG